MTTWAGIEELHPSPLRPRGKLPRPSRSLAATVSEHGPLAPVLVRSHPPGYEILSNTETWLAAQQAGHHQVPIEVRDDLTDEQARAILDAGDGRNPPDPIAEAERLEDALTLRHGTGERPRGAVAALASELGLSRSHAAHTLRLLQLPDDVQQLVRDGLLSRGHALAVLRLDGARARRRAAEHAIRRQLSVRETEALARARDPAPPPAPAPAPDPDTARLERTLSEALGTDVRLETSRGELVIAYGSNLDVLDGILARLGLGEEWC